MADRFTLRTPSDLGPFAQQLLGRHPRILALTGPLGAGKTTLTQALAEALGVQATVTSPTFALQNVYPAKHPQYDTLVHVDCYRLKDPSVELPALDLGHWFQQPKTLVVVEWADRIKNFLEKYEVVWVALSVQPDSSRRVVLS